MWNFYVTLHNFEGVSNNNNNNNNNNGEKFEEFPKKVWEKFEENLEKVTART